MKTVGGANGCDCLRIALVAARSPGGTDPLGDMHSLDAILFVMDVLLPELAAPFPPVECRIDT